MNLHEYQGKQLFAEYGLPVSKGFAVDTPEEAAEACDKIGGSEWVVKAQVHAGGRGKAGGVKLVKSKEDAKAFAQQWLGKNLVTYQTDANGQPVSKILVESCTDIDKEPVPRRRRRSFQPPHRVHGFHRRWRGHREGRPRHSREDPQGYHRPAGRRAAVPGPRAGLPAGPEGRPDQAVHPYLRRPGEAVPGLRPGLAGSEPAGDQERRQPALPGCQDQHRQQRPVPSAEAARHARPVPGRRP